MLKVLHVIATADPASGGPIEGIIRQSETSRSICERELVTVDQPSAPFIASFGLKIHPLGPEDNGFASRGLLRRYGYSPRLIPWLRRNAHRYDAVIVNGLWNFTAFGASMTLPWGKTPYFVFTHGMMDPWFRKTYPLKHLAKILFWLLVEGRLLAGARKVFFTSEEECRLARGQFPLWRYNEEVVGYGTAAPPTDSPAQRQAFRTLVPAVGERPYLLFLSRIHRKKGCDLLIDAFAKVAALQPDLQLVIAGPDQEGLVSVLQARAKALGITDRIHWPGMLKGDAKWGAYRGAEAFVLPSHQENFGIVVAEAMACGAPVLITNKVNIWREIQASGAGLVENDDAEGAEALLRGWMVMDARHRMAMREAAFQAFKSHFDVANVAPALIQTIKSAL
ncbi:glycosyltransferase [Caulobacter vibrioides]|uniref:glycosyltransferase n=1 Tax=Caulobacter vibrioides TaxID=155892 RepID=UPI000BB46BF8|nr:glycosyltransferase [Caulobacter vibrioides]ATC23456.1 glycosyl transferase [Caulobacter vibrioides]PLR11957.1 glycosyl transferase [Caulobacter vibrioides]